MTDELIQEYHNTFRTTDARSVVKYDDLMNLLEESGFTDEYCQQEVDRIKAFQDVAMKKIAEAQNANQEPDFEAIFANAPKLDEQKTTIFQTRFIQQVKDDMSLILLTTM